MLTRRRTLQASVAALVAGLFRPGKARAAQVPVWKPDPRAQEKALRGFVGIVGKDWVFDSAEDVALYRDPYSLLWGEPDERVASAAVAPECTEQVIEIVKLANEYRIPLYPISTGKNLGYGGAAPALPGSVVLDLKRMNRVLEVNERNASALVEPGVSYFDLYEHIQARGLKLWIDVPGPGWGSLIGNALDRGFGHTLAQYRNHFDAHCGMEVVLPTGELLRTGMGAMPGVETWQQFKAGYGPWIDGLFSQSNFGIVTKMGFWLMPEPEAYGTGRVTVPRYRDIIPLVDIINRLETGHIVQGLPLFSCPVAGTAQGGGPAAMLSSQQDAEIAALINDPARFSPERLEALGLEKGLPFWACEFNFYGPPQLIEAQWTCAKRALADIPGAEFEDGEVVPLPLTREQLDGMQDTVAFGVPTLRTFSVGPLTDYGGAKVVGHVFFSPLIPRDGESVIKANEVLGTIARGHGLPVTPIQFPNSSVERAFLFVIGLPVTRDKAVNARVRRIFEELIAVAAEHGWGEYRTTPAFYDAIMDTYSFNGHALRRFHETVKDALDPNGILSAGRYGIWPRHLREETA